jgi:hypothetical protein
MNTNQQALPSSDAAYQHLFDNVHAQVFFGKLASRGYTPQNEKQAQDLLTLAGRLRAVVTEKAAADNPFASAVTALDAYLGETGMDGQLKVAKAQEAAQSIKEAAAQLANDPAIYNSVLALKAQEATMVAQRFPGK